MQSCETNFSTLTLYLDNKGRGDLAVEKGTYIDLLITERFVLASSRNGSFLAMHVYLPESLKLTLFIFRVHPRGSMRLVLVRFVPLNCQLTVARGFDCGSLHTISATSAM